MLTILVAFGIAIAVLKRSPETSFVLAACAAWLALYFGRPFWGDALYLVGITPAMQLHRLIGPVQIFAVLLAAIGINWAWERSHRSVYVLLAIGLILCPAIQERRTYLAQNATWRNETRAAFTVDGPNIEAALAIAKQRGGRAYAGLPLTYGAAFRIGSVPVYSLFPPRQIPCVGYLYIGFLPQNMEMYSFNERLPTDYARMDVRTVIQPAGMPPFPGTSLIGVYGRFAVYRTGV